MAEDEVPRLITVGGRQRCSACNQVLEDGPSIDSRFAVHVKFAHKKESREYLNQAAARIDSPKKNNR